MNYIRYDAETGAIKNYGYMSDELIEYEINAGKPTLHISNIVDFENWKVNLETKELERVNPSAPLAEIPQEVMDLFNSFSGATTP